VRSINAWSPAQRYFVEGDHVISAEANRTIQFTGLDGGKGRTMQRNHALRSILVDVAVRHIAAYSLRFIILVVSKVLAFAMRRLENVCACCRH
jgi:hypothetical protein